MEKQYKWNEEKQNEKKRKRKKLKQRQRHSKGNRKIEMENYTEKAWKREGSLIGMMRLRKSKTSREEERRQ